MRDTNELSPREWKADLTSGFMVFLIALPLCLGIAMASSFPPVAGLITAIVGGVVGSLCGGARFTIKGPAAGLIVIALGAVSELSDGDMSLGYRRALAVGVVAGVLQVLLAWLRAGALGDVFPPAVVHGMLAAIGVIIVSKQAHTLVGVSPESTEPLALLAEIPHSVASMNPEIFLIGTLSLVLLLAVPRLPFAWAKRVPGPMVVVVAAIALEHIFDLEHHHTYSFHGHNYPVGPAYLVPLPGRLLSAVAFPDFSAILSPTSLKYIVMFALVGSIESLLSAKAVDRLDPEHRQSDLDRDLLVTGVANIVACSVGGLPMISEIVRSSANIDAGAKTRLSNLFHGVFLLVFVALLPSLLHQIPLAALGAMLIYTGLRLSSPNELVRTFRIGPDQLAVFTATLVVTLASDLLVGVSVGIALKLVLHVTRGAPLLALFRSVHHAAESPEGEQVLRLTGPALFTNYLSLRRRIHDVLEEAEAVIVDLEQAHVVDHTVLENLHHLSAELEVLGKRLTLRGLEGHTPASAHELSTRWNPPR